MNDRECLTSLESQIATQLQSPSGDRFDVAFKLPAEAWWETPKGWFPGWFNPLPIFENNEPVVTRGPSDTHKNAADIAYFNWLGMPSSDPQVFGGRDDDKYLCPTDTVIVYAPGPGRIWSSGYDEHGWHVRLDHGSYAGFPLNTFMTHMLKLFVPEHEGADGPFVDAGQPLGVCGAGNTHANHVHFAMYDFSDGSPSMDPTLYLPHFGRIVQP